MKSVQSKIFVILSAALCMPLAAKAAGEYSSQELSCRAKAKEVAAESYRGCVSEYKNAEIERLHKNYQKKLKALKDNYEKEVETLSGDTPSRKGKAKKVAKNRPSADESTEVKSSTVNTTGPDDSMMDLPEPVPVEN